jgi:sensor histidine kinase YesM
MKYFLFFVLSFFFCPCDAAPCFTPAGNKNKIEAVYQNVSIVEDLNGNKTVHDLIKDPSFFIKREGIYSGKNMNGKTKIYWLAFSFCNTSSENYYLEINNYYADTVQVHAVGKTGNLLKTSEFGYRMSNKQLLESNSYFFLLPQKESVVIYIRIVHREGPSFSCLNIGTPDAFYNKKISESWINALYFGAIAMMLLYNIFLLIFTRDLSYLYYVCYSFTMALYIATVNGLLYKFMGDADWWVYDHLFSLICVSNILGFLFALSFLKLKFYSTWLYATVKYMTMFTTLVCLIDYFIFPLQLPWLELLSVANSIIALLSAYVVYKKGYKPARFYLIASLSMILAIIIASLTQLRVIPNFGLSVHLLQIGAVMEMALLSIALADKINLYKSEKEEAILRKELVQMESERKQAEYKLIALKAQIKPHFIFNTINSIQHFVLEGKPKEAYYYMEKFARLIRNTLTLSDNLYISLKEELDNLIIYLEIESLRFGHSFQYQLNIDDNVSLNGLKIQPLLIQPLVENAIWHGLLQKKGERKLILSVAIENDWLLCCVEDNGIGRDESRKINLNKTRHYESKGLNITKERLLMMNDSGKEDSKLEIVDLKDEVGNPTGTKAILSIKIRQ